MNSHAEKREKRLKKKGEWINKIKSSNDPHGKEEFGKGLLLLIVGMIIAAAAFIFTRMN